MRFSGTWKDLGTWNTLTEAMDSNNVGEALFNEKCENVHVVNPVAVKTIVTIDMAERIAAKYGVKTINVLTGFKFIGEQIGFLEKQGKEDSYIFGMEESYGYLSGSYVRDKDGVNAAFLICEMFTYYASQGIGLFEKLNELYNAAEISLNAERCRTYKIRQEQVRLLKEILSVENLWQAVIAFQDYPFKTATGLPFRYKLKVGKDGEYNRELLIDRREKSKSLAWSSVVLAFENSKKVSEEVKKPKALGDIRGVSYIYSILWRFGIIRVPEAIEKKMGKQR